MLNTSLTIYLDDNELLVDEQNWFRKDRSCEDHIFTLNSRIQKRDSTFVTFIGLQKAFDTVDQDLLQYSLFRNGVDGHLYNNNKALYKNTESCVRLGDPHTEWFQCTSGVRQRTTSHQLYSLNSLTALLMKWNCLTRESLLTKQILESFLMRMI